MIVSFYAVISLNVYFPFRLGGDGIMMFFLYPTFVLIRECVADAVGDDDVLSE